VSNEELLKAGALELGLKLDEKAAERFLLYLSLIKKWNEKINLTSIRADRDIIIRHFLDSLIPLEFLCNSRSLLDIGTGAGFPGMPIKIARGEIKTVLLESVGKKVYFLKEAIRTLGLESVEAVRTRAEEKPKELLCAFDCVISRALTDLAKFHRLATPYLKKGGIIIAMKGPVEKKLSEEIKTLGCEIYERTIPFTEIKTSIVILRG
jgi:16S rRNA (guanine527-N7)-methyltransferase